MSGLFFFIRRISNIRQSSFLGHFFRIAKFSLGSLFLDCVVCTTVQCAVLEVAAGITCMVSQERLKASVLSFQINIFRGRNLQFVVFCFLFFFFFIFIDLNKQDCDRRCLEKDSFYFIIFTFVLDASPFVSDELWDNLSSCFQLLCRSHQTFYMGLISIKA